MRKIFIGILILLFVVGGIWLFLFLTKPAVRPVAPTRSMLDSTLTLPVSTIRVPIEFQIKDLERMINTKLSGIFVQEAIAVGEKKKDSIYLELERTDSIRFAWQPSWLFAKIPLRISFRFKKRALGINFQNEKPIVAEVILNLKSQVFLADDWGIKSTTTLDSIIWQVEPSLKVAFVNVHLRKLADSYLEKNQVKITQRFDSLAHVALDTRKVVKKLWQDIHKPIVIKKTEPKIGLSAHAVDLRSRWTSNEAGNITGMITLKAKVHAWFDEAPVQKIDPLPKHRFAERAEEKLDLFVMAQVPFEKLNTLANSNLHKLSYSYQSYTIAIHDNEFYGSGQELALRIKVKGALRGSMYLRATPYFDTVTQVVGLRELRYDLSTEETLLNTADWMLHDKLISMISDTIKKDLTQELSGLPQLIEQAIERGKSGKKLNLTVDSLAVTSYASLITAKDIQWILRARGKAGIELEKKILEKKKKK